MSDETTQPGEPTEPAGAVEPTAPLREVLDAAWNHVEKFERGGAPPAPEQKPDDAQPEPHPEHGGRDTHGRFAPKQNEPGTVKAPAAPRTEVQPEAVPPPPVPAAPAAFKPPQSWRPVEREALSKADPVVQQAVQRREREVAQVLQQSAPVRKFAEEWTRTVQPYEQMIRASGVTPLAAVNNLFRVAQALSTQPVPTRAGIIAGLMRSYGVGEADLAAVLQGQPAPQGQPVPQPTHDPRVDEIYQQWNEYRATTQQAAEQAEDAALEEFAAAHPWLDDLADVMSDAMAVAAQRGESMDYEEAYSRALMLRPDLMEIEQQRASASAGKAPTPDPRNAALSVRGNPRVRARASDKPLSTREAAEAAWDLHAGDGNRV